MSDFVEHKLLQGQGAGKWLPFARTKVTALHARAKARRVTALVQRWTVEGGDVEIAVRVVGDQRYIHIRRKSCPTFASGMAEAIFNPAFAASPLVPLTTLIETTVPGDPDHPQFAFQRFFPSVRDAISIGEPRAFRNEPRLARDLEATQQILQLHPIVGFRALKSGQCTGEMRKVVQVLMGMNEFVPYDPTFGRTHGVFVSANGTRWVVEISNQGVVAWVMNVCTARPVTAGNGDVLLPYTPLPSPKPLPVDIPAAITAGTFKVLADAGAVLDFYTKSPFFSYCGWAFSANGHEAANVGASEAGIYIQSSMYKIVVTEQDGIPTAASMQLMEQGLFSGVNGVHVKYPLSEGKLSSFRTQPVPFIPIASNCPVYCWYNGNTLVVARHEYTPGASSQAVTENDTDGTNVCESQLGKDLLNGSREQVNLPVLSIDGTAPTPARLFTDIGNTIRYDLGDPLGGEIQSNVIDGGLDHNNIYDGVVTTRAPETNDSHLTRATLIIPFHDREAAYLAVEDTHNFAAVNLQIFTRFPENGATYDSECALECTAFPAACVIAILGVGGQILSPAPCLTGHGGTRWIFTSTTNINIGAVAGSAFQVGLDDATCSVIPNLNPFMSGTTTEVHSDAYTTVSYRFEFIASGGVKSSLPIPIFPDRLVSLIDEGETQLAAASRDAFNPERYAISPHVIFGSGIPRYIASDDAGYPIFETARSPTWLGVP